MWILRRPLRRPRRLAALLLSSVAAALLGGITLTSLYPVLVILFDPGWSERLRALAGGSWGPVRPLLESIVSWLSGSEPFAALVGVLAALLAGLALAAGAQLLQDWLAAPIVHGCAQEIATEAHDALLNGAAADAPQGDVLARFTADLDAIRVALQKVLGKVVHEPFKLAFLLALLVAIDAKLALLAGLLFPAAAGSVLFLARRLRDTARKTLAQTSSLVALVEEGLRGRRVVRAFGLEERERGRFLEVQGELTRNLVQLDRHEALSSPLLELLAGAAAAGCILLGAHRVLRSELSPEALLTFFAVLVSTLDPMRKLADTHVRTQRGAAAAARMRRLIASVPSEPPVRGTTPFRGVRARLELREVGVRSEGGAELLRGVDLRAAPGEIVLVAGRSGAGKSTLIDVIAGLRRYHAGTVAFDGVRLEELEAASFRARVGLVTQETFLFRGTIRENVTLGRAPRRTSLAQALERAGLSELVASLEAGVETPLQSRAFSAGERQRLSIARALYRDPDLLLLDEATSALDRPVEEAILRAVLADRSGRITFVVSHRLSAGIAADQVVLLEDGAIAARGRPAELLAESALYRDLVHGTAAAAERAPG